MNIGNSIDLQALVLRQHFTPFSLISFKSPIVPIKSPPKDGPAVFVQILFGYHTGVISLNIHHTNRIINLASNSDPVPAHDIQKELLILAGGDDIPVSTDIPFCG